MTRKADVEQVPERLVPKPGRCCKCGSLVTTTMQMPGVRDGSCFDPRPQQSQLERSKENKDALVVDLKREEGTGVDGHEAKLQREHGQTFDVVLLARDGRMQRKRERGQGVGACSAWKGLGSIERSTAVRNGVPSPPIRTFVLLGTPVGALWRPVKAPGGCATAACFAESHDGGRRSAHQRL